MSDSESDTNTSNKSVDPKSLTSIRSIRIDGRQILRHYEEDLRNDLAVHLYSAHLSHKQNQEFPGDSWASWPMAKDKVPNPKTLERYTDESGLIPSDDEPVSKLNGNVILRKNKRHIPIGEQKHEGEIEEDNDVEGKKSKQDDAEGQLDQEINAIFQRKLHEKFVNSSKKRMKYEIQPKMDDTDIPSHHIDSIKQKLDNIFEKFPSNTKVGRTSSIYDWKDILLKSGIEDPKFHQKAHKMFVSDADKFLKDFQQTQVDESSEEDESSSDDEDSDTDTDADSNADSSDNENGNVKEGEDEDEGPDSRSHASQSSSKRSREYNAKMNLIRKQIRDKLLQEML